MKEVIAVIVTYNRFSLLKKAIAAIEKQTYPIKEIIIVNNGSTDETVAWLANQNKFKVIYIKENTGASGGFYHGIKAAASMKMDWIWVMDDDTICQENALKFLMDKAPKIHGKLGFIGSRCNWRDGEPHLMNVPNIKPVFNKAIPFNYYDQYNLLLAESNSWVSLLLNIDAVRDVGLPYKEFFFWSDDLEYTQRITQAGYMGFYCTDSIVLHDTDKNYCPDFYNETINNVWKYKYGFRNEFFLKRKSKGYIYFAFWLIAKVGYTSYKLIKIRKDHQFKFIGILFSSAWESIFFNPKIEKVHLI